VTTPQPPADHPLEGWDLGRFASVAWVPWGSGDGARARVLAQADGFHLALVEAEAGYTGDPHVHAHPEFLYVVEGTVRTQGRTLVAGDAYAAAPGSEHTDFTTETGATYLSIFKI
jgi:quercetin dioxygenase-like cupin family protein